jgi:glucosylceramidase
VAFRNANGTVVLYALNAGAAGQDLRIGFHGKMVATTIPGGSVATFVWKP